MITEEAELQHPPAQKIVVREKRKGRFKHGELFSLSVPGLIYLFVFSYVPMFGILIAFKNYRYDKGILGSEWVGFKNFEFLFASENAWRITRNTVLYSLTYIVVGMLIAVTLAILLTHVGKNWVKLHQTVLFLPYFVSWVVVGYIALAFLDNTSGYLNQLLGYVGLAPHKWYFESGPWPYILVIAHEWKSIGFATLIYFAGLLGINQDYYEAARIDGASKLQMVRKITLPLLLPLMTIMLILAIGNMFRGDFGLHYFVPNDSSFALPATDIIDTYVFRSLRMLGDIGMSSAAGVYQSVVGFVLVLAANYAVRKINHENALF
ncbi:sugar ABC transporter permease [Paenibacillus sp. MWE-103]|uniref:Sugar ABC transporter permease n=1 Tax=Paenibacillus artemisiicola TaxID=1172618 RepID=A0ABS3W576_9BACL|nr:ABC transporter permease subunit [Paenibacillus artemisiicola]MBO7743466.1 sugar ABC transporter permease [Paenibacillus artemisiicola]